MHSITCVFAAAITTTTLHSQDNNYNSVSQQKKSLQDVTVALQLLEITVTLCILLLKMSSGFTIIDCLSLSPYPDSNTFVWVALFPGSHALECEH